MKKATKAALLSALVFPGCGHLYLKRWLTGVVLVGIAGYAIYRITSVILGVTRAVLQQVESGAVVGDIDTITRLVTQQMSGSEQATSVASTALLACWILGIVGAYWQGRVQDKLEAGPRSAASRSDINEAR